MNEIVVSKYAKLWDYAEEIRTSNPGSTVKMEVRRMIDESPPIFKFFYVCLNSCKRGMLSGCRHVLGLDGCFLKGLVKGELLTAIGKDGNNEMFPVAWAVVEVENKESWEKFLELLKDDMCTIQGAGWTLITDQQKVILCCLYLQILSIYLILFGLQFY